MQTHQGQVLLRTPFPSQKQRWSETKCHRHDGCLSAQMTGEGLLSLGREWGPQSCYPSSALIGPALTGFAQNLWEVLAGEERRAHVLGRLLPYPDGHTSVLSRSSLCDAEESAGQ